MFGRELTFAVIAFILVIPAIEFLSIFSSPSEAFALKSSSTGTLCTKGGVPTNGPDADKCCYFTTYEFDDGSPIGTFEYCADCHNEGGQLACGDFECVTCKRPLPLGNLPQAEIVPPIKTLPGLPAGDLPVLEQVPPPILEPVVPQETIEETGPGLNQGTEGEPPLPVICSAGLEKDPETGQCVPIEPGGLPQLEQVPPNGILPGGGNLPTLEQGPGLTQGTEGEPPLPVVCSEEAGLEKDPETGQCVPIEAPVTEEQPEEAPEEEPEEEQTEPEEEQPAEESGSGDGSNN